MTADTVQTTVRMTDEDRRNIETIIGTGAATNASEAIRVALAEYAQFAGRMAAMQRALEKIAKSMPPPSGLDQAARDAITPPSGRAAKR